MTEVPAKVGEQHRVIISPYGQAQEVNSEQDHPAKESPGADTGYDSEQKSQQGD